MPVDEDILKELKKISKIITLSNGSTIEKELSKFATTDKRKQIWALIDGRKNSDQIAKEIGVTNQAVLITLQHFESAELVEERKYGIPPKRILDYVPSAWIELLPKNSKLSEESQTPVITPPTKQSSPEATPNV